ncbi:MAG: hypothetical protein JWM80_2866 [Cyanobacteria bacterium RYN_339]|nr:hypothetical protein [Cyanobacteria bacterium RYN_339]
MGQARAVEGGWQVEDLEDAHPDGAGDGRIHVLAGGAFLALAILAIVGGLLSRDMRAFALLVTFLGPLGLVAAVVFAFGLFKLYERSAAEPGVLVSADWPLVPGQAAPMTFRRKLLWRARLNGPARLAWSVVKEAGGEDFGELDLGPFDIKQDGPQLDGNWLVPVPTLEEAAERLGKPVEALEGATWRLVIGLDMGRGPAADSVYKLPVQAASLT